MRGLPTRGARRIARRAAGSAEDGRAGVDQQDEQADQAFGHWVTSSYDVKGAHTATGLAGPGVWAPREGARRSADLLPFNQGAHDVEIGLYVMRQRQQPTAGVATLRIWSRGPGGPVSA